MPQHDLVAYVYICFFLWGGMAVAVLPFVAARLVRPRARISEKTRQT